MVCEVAEGVGFLRGTLGLDAQLFLLGVPIAPVIDNGFNFPPAGIYTQFTPKPVNPLG